MGFHVSERTHENLLNYLCFRSHKGNVWLQGAAARCCMREADFCLGRIMDGSRPCLLTFACKESWMVPELALFFFPKQKCSPIEFLFISSSIDRRGAIISSHPPFCAEGEGEVSLFPFSMGLFAVHNGLFSKWKTTHFKILEITFKKKNQHTAKS